MANFILNITNYFISIDINISVECNLLSYSPTMAYPILDLLMPQIGLN